MGRTRVIFGLFLLVISFFFTSANDNAKRKAYIVYMGRALEGRIPAVQYHNDLLLKVIKDKKIARRARIHSYEKSFNAFAAYLLPEEAQRLREYKNVISVFPSGKRKLFTTNSWNFLGMPESVERNLQVESDIIIGMIDSGIDIDSPSFNDEGYGPPPSKWKGSCQVGTNFSGCNNKVIGAKVYDLLHIYPNPTVADTLGHGTHTASTVAGSAVQNASYSGIAKGTARGGVPSARIAMYKVCHIKECVDVDILAALDDAIADGVDILSMSLGAIRESFLDDVLAIGSFHATKKGILVSAAAGNQGPDFNTSSNGAPWILTVGATISNRQLRTPVIVGDRKDPIMGISLNTFNLTDMYPLQLGPIEEEVAGESRNNNNVAIKAGGDDADNIVEGNIVVSTEFNDEMIKHLGGVGLINFCDPESDVFKDICIIPCACVPPSVGAEIAHYINSTDNPKGSILQTIEVQDESAPTVVFFSSRGPDRLAPSIIKPDIVAPGVEILAAYSRYSEGEFEGQVFTFKSGTSMACPHVSGAAAYIKSFHPDWSTAAIKSALITTANEMNGKDASGEFAYGAGQMDPTRALNPGLVYDMDTMDYVRFLCNMGYSGEDLEKIIGEGGVDCSTIPKHGGEDDLNYPSMLLMQKDSNSNVSAVFNRTAKNVGDANSSYKANVTTSSNDVHITVTPDTLVFEQVNQVMSFTVQVNGPPLKDLGNSSVSASLVWTDSDHNVRVRSPILIFPQYIL